MDKSRLSNATPKNLNEFYDMLDELYYRNHYHPTVIGNFDETMLQESRRKLKVVVASDSANPLVSKAEGRPHITLGVTIFADGSSCSPILIFPSKRLPVEIDLESIDNYLDSSFAGQDSGWMTAQLFEEHCKETIIPDFEKRLAKLRPNSRGLLFLDGHSSRANPDMLQAFSDANVDLVTFVSHTSHVCQPLDLVVFGTFKNQLGNSSLSFQSADSSLKRREFVSTALRCYYTALFPLDVKKAFARAGLWPLDRKSVLSNNFVREPLQASSVPEISKKKRKAVDINNKVITHPEVIAQLRAKPKKPSKRPTNASTKSNAKKRPSTLSQSTVSPISEIVPASTRQIDEKSDEEDALSKEPTSAASETSCDELGPSYHIVVVPKRKRGRPRKSPPYSSTSMSECARTLNIPFAEPMEVDEPLIA